MAAGGFMAGQMIGRNLDLLKKGVAEANEAWKALSSKGLELSQEPTTSVFKQTVGATWPSLRGNVGGAPIEVHVRCDAVYFARTEICATAKAKDVVVGVHLDPGGLMGYLREWIGQDIHIGDEQFDPAYLITGRPESAAISFLVPSVRELFMALGPKLGGFTHEKEAIKVVLHGVETDPLVLGAAIDLAAAAATWSPT